MRSDLFACPVCSTPMTRPECSCGFMYVEHYEDPRLEEVGPVTRKARERDGFGPLSKTPYICMI